MTRAIIRILTVTSIAIPGAFALAALTPSAASAQTFPGSVKAHYVTDDNSTGNRGTRGSDEADRQVSGGDPGSASEIIDVGAPWNNGSTYGSIDWAPTDNHIHFSTINGWIENYADKWYAHSNSSIHLTILLATNNNVPNWLDSADGQHLGNSVDTIDNYLDDTSQNQCSCTMSYRIVVVGASDMETGWGGPNATENYVDGYRGATSHHFFDTGDAGGCSQTTHGNSGCNGSWTQSDVLDVSWRVTDTLAFPFPQIYCNNNGHACYQDANCNYDSQACQWLQIDLYSHTSTTRGFVNFRGATSQLALTRPATRTTRPRRRGETSTTR